MHHHDVSWSKRTRSSPNSAVSASPSSTGSPNGSRTFQQDRPGSFRPYDALATGELIDGAFSHTHALRRHLLQVFRELHRDPSVSRRRWDVTETITAVNSAGWGAN
jgi:hypothetical protein